ncbi:nitroreductase family protein [Candidatus Cetobacterium colombiensis]|uniref:Nitroreductase family protein n=1 Tax=Candidatus Cetobacterium colombiensis TaxID=3073100 RepID=A0ABU4W7V3_9FUSO|nr:nitroreductase family protein [Candidatus Cetobacterium colombiensis]MDX8335592.1 nitroreductase family protein [Candidatus Cetobacterium colombiensis]
MTNLSNNLDVLMNRKSVRAYEDKPLSQDVKEAIVNATLRAPTAGNMMMYSIIEITDENLKNKLVKTCDNQPMIAKAPYLLLFLADFQRWMDYLKASNVDKFNQENNLSMYHPKEGDLLLSINDALIAAQTAVTAAEMLEVGSCYIGDIMENFEIHREMFNLPKYTFPVTLICFGYPTEQQKNRQQPPRYPKDMILFENQYRHIEKDEFDNMEIERNKISKPNFLPGCSNEAIHMYKRKITSDFMKEMNRSVKAALDSWTK